MIFSLLAVGTIFSGFFIGFFQVLTKFFRVENQYFSGLDEKQLKKMLDTSIYLLPLHQRQHNKSTTLWTNLKDSCCNTSSKERPTSW